ncbi:metal-dependent phosphohydrolase [Planosporangium sp. 12N6]|uniref:HD domain-containing protein n=1 Tax=Planosporangium spinosum TaxID=3402278 RepID=UPI003CEA6093
MSTDTTDLLTRWRALVPAGDALGADLLARWAEPHRHYHDTGHLAVVLAVVDRYADLVPDADAVRLAGWFHDAVYDPRAGDNEERSAALAEDRLPAAGIPAARVAETARLVRLTAGHVVADGDRDGALLADADLAVLAADRYDYDRYAAAVRREYAHVSDGAFRAGRSGVLDGLLALPALYRIVPERAEWEVRARANLERELRELRQRP